ncbi:CHAT domain-containing protein [Friedmanniella luteola]|uniref:CHAT domain-containing protein n=1 Tax=Friedmanniella luteola TaxID=546871 RepID=A0A1H1YQA4_9ACTN|nr:CHAT domain-containing protein [Friedmanniella luteola]SDT23530.1 CHAT domain-containing protein [Friedmanniella luteola]
MLPQAAAAHRRAQAQCDRGRFDLAHRGLLRALDLLDRSPEPAAEVRAVRVRVLMTLAVVEEETTGDGGSRLQDARRLVEGVDDAELRFAVHNAAATRALRRGDHPAALAEFAAAERLLAAASPRDAAILHLNRGNLALQRLDLPAARRDLERAVQLTTGAEDAGQRSVAFMAAHNLGYLEHLRGNLPRALQLMDEAATLSAGTSLAISGLDRARVLIEAGLTDAADAVLARAEQEFRRGRLAHERAETELARADCALLGDRLADARALAGSARTRFARRGHDRWRRVAELTLLTADLADGRPPARLLGPARRLAEEFAAQDLELPARTAALLGCAALTALGRPAEARAWFAGLHPIGRTDPIGLKLQQRVVAAEISLAEHQAAAARSQVRLGLTELSRHQAQFGSLDLQTAGAVHGRRLVALDLRLALAARRPAALFNAVERGRAVSRRLTAVTPPADASEPALAELRQVTDALRTLGDDPAERASVVALRQRSAELYGQLNAIAWRAVGAGAVVHAAPMATVAEQVEAQGKVLVSYVVADGRWSAVVLGRDRPRFVDLPGDARTVELSRRAQADLDVLALGGVPAAVRAAVEQSLRRSLAVLDAQLVGPLRLADEALVVVPTGPTSTLPWTCLPSLRGRPVEVSPTATSWLVGGRGGTAEGPVRLAALAGPGLVEASAEVHEVAAAWGAWAETSTATGADATRARLTAGLGSATVLHVAAHGSHQRQSPLFSSLQLADGALFAYEVEAVAPHVVLSACELGQATTRPGDEALGWTRVLLQLGTRCVVAGVSQVADDRAREVMVAYHRRLAAGDDAATALAGATEHGTPVPFVCFGTSWRAVPPPAQLPEPAQVALAAG